MLHSLVGFLVEKLYCKFNTTKVRSNIAVSPVVIILAYDATFVRGVWEVIEKVRW